MTKSRVITQIYVDDIVFGATRNNDACKFAETMESEFEMSMMGELTYFLGLQAKQSEEGIHLCQSKYAKELVKKFGLENSKDFPTPMETSNKGLGSESLGESVDEKLYRSMIGSLLYVMIRTPAGLLQ